MLSFFAFSSPGMEVMLFPMMIGGAAVVGLTLSRVSLFEAVLPISARRVIFTRTAFGCLLTSLPFVAWMIGAALESSERVSRRSAIDNTMSTAVFSLACALLAVIVPNVFRRGQLLIPRAGFWVLALLAVPILFSVGAIVPTRAIYMPSASLDTPPLLTLAVGLTIPISCYLCWVRTPVALQVAELTPVSGWNGLRVTDSAKELGLINGKVTRLLIQQATGIQALLPSLILLVADVWMGFMYLALYTVGNITDSRPRVRWMRTMPISRQRLAALSILPPLIPVILLLLFTKATHNSSPFRSGMNDMEPDSEVRGIFSSTSVSLNFWHLTRHGDTQPTIVAPWGETAPAQTITVFGIRLYNPYTAWDSSSTQFRDWQFARATTAAYGRALTRNEHRRDLRPAVVTRLPRMIVLLTGVGICIILIANIMYELPRHKLFGRSKLLRLAVTYSGIAVLLGILAVDMYHLHSIGTVLSGPALDAGLLHVSNVLPGGLLAPIALVVTIAGILWMLLARLFSRGEYGERVLSMKGGWDTWWTARQS